MKSLHYLTVQDFLWLNLELEKQMRSYEFAKLEEAANYQYGLGGSIDVAAQAGRVFGGFVKLAPFVAGNSATGFIGAIGFARRNGIDVDFGSDRAALEWVKERSSAKVPIGAALTEKLAPVVHNGVHVETVQETLKSVISEYPRTLVHLMGL